MVHSGLLTSSAFGVRRPTFRPLTSFQRAPTTRHALTRQCSCQLSTKAVEKTQDSKDTSSRREVVLRSVNVAVLASLFTFGAAPRPSNLGVKDYGNGVKSLALCPASNNCISTAEEANSDTHYVPPWTYNPTTGRGRKNPVSQDEAMAELAEVVGSIKPDNFTPTIIKKSKDYLYAEFQSPTFGFIDDVEFWFKDGPNSEVEYRSASRIGESDGDINRKRIRAIRKELEKKGWRSVGY